MSGNGNQEAIEDLLEQARSGVSVDDAGIDESDMLDAPVIEISPGASEENHG